MDNANNGFLIVSTFCVAFILTLLPMPDWTVWLRPAWVLLALIYWSMYAPYRVNVGVAWICGIFLDLLNGTLLGEHALALTIVTFIVVRMHTRLLMFPVLQQGLSVCLLVFLYQLIIYCTQGFIGELPHTWLYWSSSLTSMILWPWVYSVLTNSRRRSKIIS